MKISSRLFSCWSSKTPRTQRSTFRWAYYFVRVSYSVRVCIYTSYTYFICMYRRMHGRFIRKNVFANRLNLWYFNTLGHFVSFKFSRRVKKSLVMSVIWTYVTNLPLFYIEMVMLSQHFTVKFVWKSFSLKTNWNKIGFFIPGSRQSTIFIRFRQNSFSKLLSPFSFHRLLEWMWVVSLQIVFYNKNR